MDIRILVMELVGQSFCKFKTGMVCAQSAALIKIYWFGVGIEGNVLAFDGNSCYIT